MMFDFKKYNDNLAVITDQGEQLTYGELYQRTKISVPRGLVFCLAHNNLDSLLGYITCLQSDLPIVMLDGSKPKEVIDALIDVYHPEYIWDGGLKETGMKGGDINPELSLCLTTSGSTGSPKFVRLSAKNILANAESIAEYLGIEENERPVTTLPMYYSYGLSVINSHLLKGATILLTDQTYAQREFWNFMKERKATSMAGVPYTYEMLKRLRIFRMDLPYLKTMTQAGGKLNKDIAKEFIDFAAANGKKFYVMYGQTEATARMSYLPWESAQEKYASIGVAIPGGKLSVRDVNDQEITTPDIDGELIYEGSNVCLGYAECRADLAKSNDNHGVLHTGDIARFDSDGFFYITGRMKRFVKVWGNRCNLDATEQLVKNITNNCACVGVDDKITIFVMQEGLEEKIKTYLVDKTGLNIRAFDVKAVETIPTLPSGKLDYQTMQKMI